MKKVYIIHGWSGSPLESLHQWLKAQFEAKGFAVTAPEMPDTDHPKIETWVPFLQKLVGVPDENTFFIGHSIGCQTILRFIETLPEGVKIGGAVFIAGWYNVRNLDTEEEEQIVGPWVNAPRDDEKIRRTINNKATVILSDNDPFVALENKNAWEQKAGAKVVTVPGMGHFTEDDGVTALPLAVDALEELAAGNEKLS